MIFGVSPDGLWQPRSLSAMTIMMRDRHPVLAESPQRVDSHRPHSQRATPSHHRRLINGGATMSNIWWPEASQCLTRDCLILAGNAALMYIPEIFDPQIIAPEKGTGVQPALIQAWYSSRRPTGWQLESPEKRRVWWRPISGLRPRSGRLVSNRFAVIRSLRDNPDLRRPWLC